MNLVDQIRESNRIEGIEREPSGAEIAEHRRFIALPALSIDDLRRFVSVYQPNAILREREGLNVRVGAHIPPPGGPQIPLALVDLLRDVNRRIVKSWDVHLKFETLHPFTDCNGRLGRAIWYWMMNGTGLGELGFLHAFYYQTLREQAK